VREHGGFITCKSAKGAGTSFSFYLPLASGPATPRRATSEFPVERGTETVLIVDDEPLVRAAVSRLLESSGYATMEAGSGTEAIELLADPTLASKVGLIILDVSMPGPPPRELRSRLREVTRARVIYLSGLPREAVDPESDDTVVEKPVTQARLLSSVRQELDRA
jgi:CheY-like chemotaxis protein